MTVAVISRPPSTSLSTTSTRVVESLDDLPRGLVLDLDDSDGAGTPSSEKARWATLLVSSTGGPCDR